MVIRLKFIGRLASLIFSISLLFYAGCRRDEKTPLVFTPIDLNLFSETHKGFNLLGKFDAAWSNSGFQEEEFAIVKDLGFNFVRLPLDYRTYTQTGNWNVFLDEEVSEIDDAIDWGKKYGVHVCLNLHRAPGYCVNPGNLPANQNLDLWTDPVAQEAFVNQWAFFAERYKNIPYNELSFNLVNEPGDMDENVYTRIMKLAIDRIQQINPDRIIFVDGLNYGRKLITSLKTSKNIIQAIHVYDPFTLTHYKASWVSGSDTWPVPVWPMTDISQYLYGPVKQEYFSSLIFEGNFAPGTEITVNVQQVSVQSTLQIKLDDNEIYKKEFICGPDPGEDWSQIILTQWGYQNISGKDYSVILPAGGTKLAFTNIRGDWMTYNRITIKNGTWQIEIIPANTSWGSRQDTYRITSDGKITDKEGNPVVPLTNLTNALKLAKTENIPVMVQEFGVYNQTPHTVTLAYLTDVIAVLKKNKTGYAMWNLIGTMGIINSGRTDCIYEEYRGKSLDREMTTVIQ